MRVLFTTTPAIGHVHPMVPLADAFKGQGDTVAWVAHTSVCSILADEGFVAMPAGLGARESQGEFYRRFPEVEALPPEERPAFMFPRLFGTVRTNPMLIDLLPIVRDWKPSLIINEAGEFAGPIAAALAGVPNLTHAFGSLILRERVEAAAAEVAPLWDAQGLQPRPFGGLYDHLYLDIYPASLQRADMSHVATTQLLRPVAFATAGSELLPDWTHRDATAPLVYVTFGTVFNHDVAMIGTVIEAIRALPVRVLVTTGPDGDPTIFGPQPDNVHIARYIPQTALLPFCAAVLSHAGSGTFLAALARGLPQVCVPLAADQFVNAAACEQAGAGVVLHPGAVTVDAVRGAVERVLSDDTVLVSAQRLAQEIEAMPAPSTVATLLRERYSR